jgi:alpha-D-ribose 1-methylphosphonate 5-triphosphate diphosphatase
MDAIVRLIRNKGAEFVSLTDQTPDRRQSRDLAAHVHYYSREFGVTLSQVENILGETLQSTTGTLQRMEDIARVARQHDVPLASLGDDSPDTVNMMYELGVRVAEFPVTLAAAVQARRQNMHTVFGAPNIVRNTGRRGTVRAMEALRQGVLACLCSAHSPTSLIKTLLPVVKDGGLTLPQAVQLVSANPAAAAGLSDRGAIRAELRADFVVVGFAEGMPVVFSTFSRGRQVYGTDYHEEPSRFALAC